MSDIPQNPEAEEACIAAVMFDPRAFFRASQIVSADDFYIVRHRWVWEGFTHLTNRHAPIEYLTLQEQLSRDGHLEEVGGPSYITSLLTMAATSSSVESYARMVADSSERRKGLAAANELASRSMNLSEPFSLGDQSLKLAQAARKQGNRVTPSEAASKTIDSLVNPRYCTTGIVDVDQHLGGLFAGELGVWAGYQGTGKSAAMIHSARANADAGKKVMVATLEMSAVQVWTRMACGDLGMDVNKARSGQLPEDTLARIAEKSAELGEQYNKNLILYDTRMSPGDIMAAAIIEEPDIVFVDTLRNIAGKPDRVDTRSWYDHVCLFLRDNVAKPLSTNVTVLHHLSRESFKDGRKPTIHDLMFAGESDSDLVILLHRPDDDNERKTIAEVDWIIGKSRFGWIGSEATNYDLIHQRFFGMTRQ